MEFSLKCPVYPTETIDIIRRCLEIFLSLPFEIVDIRNIKHIVMHSDDKSSILLIREKIHDLRIIDAVRKRLLHNWNGTSSFFKIDKQVLTVGGLRILDDSNENPPLGSVLMEFFFESELEFKTFVEWFTPPTKDGKIL